MSPHRPFFRVVLPLAALLAGGALALPAPVARADDGPGGDAPATDDLEVHIKAQMDKILRLMRDNEKALLDASVTGGKRPDAVQVTPPPAAPEGAAKTGEPPAGKTPPGEGEDARKRIEEILHTTQQRAGTIPGELENLVKMIPT